MKKLLQQKITEHIEAVSQIGKKHLDKIVEIASIISNALNKGNKVLVFGNGGSASDSQHFTGELVGRFSCEREGFAAVALTTDSSIITSVGNDYGYEKVFERQIRALARHGDIAFGISTSGNSENVVKAVEAAHEKGCRTICLLGKDGGKLKDICELDVTISCDNTQRIQECHEFIIHALCDLIERRMINGK